MLRENAANINLYSLDISSAICNVYHYDAVGAGPMIPACFHA